jgi:hypothetical protein
MLHVDSHMDWGGVLKRNETPKKRGQIENIKKVILKEFDSLI